MSEYQYYEFRAIDRPLTDKEMASLGAISSRAHITSTSFVNVYNYGDFRGKPETLMEKYFDAFLYVANWGTHTLMLRLPKHAMGSLEYAPFQAGDNLRVWCKGEYAIVCLNVDELETDWEEGEGLIDPLLPIRADLLRGDFRALYLGWLLGVQSENVEDDMPEPPLPAGLRELSASLQSLVEFLDIDADLLEVAAEVSADRESAKCAASEPSASRTAGELRAAADRRASENARRDEERRLLEQEREAQRRAAERTIYLDELETRETQSWDQLDTLNATKRPTDYDRAVTVLTDLRDLAKRRDGLAAYRERLRNLCARYAAKPAFLRRIKAAGLES